MAADLILEQFVPYRLSLVANRVSRSLSRIYADRFGLSIPQWRVLAVLAQHKRLSAEQVARFTAMDKVAVSRAVARLAGRRYLRRRRDPADRRRSVLSLSRSGRSVYEQIAPLACDYERALLQRLNSARSQLEQVLTDLEQATDARD